MDKKLKKVIQELITVKDLMQIFGLNHRMQVTRLRQEMELDIVLRGSERDNVRFHLPDVIEWSKENKKPTPGLKKWKKLWEKSN